MKAFKTLFLAPFFAVTGFTAPQPALDPPINIQKEMTQYLDTVRSIFEAGYAPRAWKQQFAGWDLNTTVENLKTKITAQTTIKEFQLILKEFFYSTKDYHVGIQFLNTETATLPLTVRGSQGRYFLAFIDRQKLPSSSFPFNEGDELLEFADKPIAEAIAEVRAQGEKNVEQTDQALAEIILTRRRSSRGYQVPQGPVVLGIKATGSDAVKRVQLIWDYTPENVTRLDGSGKRFFKPVPFSSKKGHPSFIDRPMMLPEFEEEILNGSETNKFMLGEKVSYLPELGKIVWRNPAEKFFNAYIFQDANKRLIGVIRIASYVPSVSPAAAVAEFAEILKHFNGTTEALVIDQLNNPGGSVFYLYALASMLSDQPLYAPKHRMTLLPSDISEAVTMIPQLEKVTNDEEAKKLLTAELSGFPVDYNLAKFILGYCKFVVAQWNEGKRLTDPYYLWGADKINPSQVVQYTKPILVLVNELDFSGGDFFPTILQDNKRAKIMGTRTAGAGGYVLEVKLPNLFGVDAFQYTGSLAERIDKNPIENLGVTPDVALGLTPEDFTEGFTPFKNKVLEELNKFFQ